ncbi:phospholipid/cholesterol/gamma-HCH transport system substrate-binding protein [Nocardioides daedukensis]|uniref:Phospholipid/cholesterol/gamma-HCH transport system substrate-binding protein n=1 Tax=Nocardioides daedukensis TaxID=634462 RepID=A0A7Y9UVT0_9ACTN|nr:MCE family protein [Nocardioides daedukensis]NYG58800.1 phospholipid/cholesterol/gamma-HCH transport system substrate-binding protein [Nocardioides daedukensis]
MFSVLRNKKLIGIVFIALLASGVWLTSAIFNKTFVDYDRVTMDASSVGLQLPARADVKIRGVQVGEVLETKADKDGAVVTLGLYPEKVGTIPANVTARIEPKTLFGEKYVALQVPEQPSTEAISAGDNIDRSVLATEVEETLNDLYPLLRAVQPADLNKTLTALATALEGRGEAIGDNLVTLDSYLKRINPEIPALIEDLKLTAEVSDTYADVLPEIATTLRNTVTTGETLVSREAKLNKLFTDVSKFSDVAGSFLDDNEQNLIRVGELGARQLKVLARYSPSFPCLLEGIVKAGDLQAEAFRGYMLHINLEILPNFPREYDENDRPKFGADDGPYCGTLPSPSFTQEKPLTDVPDFEDGVTRDTGKGTKRAATGGYEFGVTPGSAIEAELVRGLMVAASGKPPSDLSVLLTAPLLRGKEVNLR